MILLSTVYTKYNFYLQHITHGFNKALSVVYFTKMLKYANSFCKAGFYFLLVPTLKLIA